MGAFLGGKKISRPFFNALLSNGFLGGKKIWSSASNLWSADTFVAIDDVNSNIVWVCNKGFLYVYDFEGQLLAKSEEEEFVPNKTTGRCAYGMLWVAWWRTKEGKVMESIYRYIASDKRIDHRVTISSNVGIRNIDFSFKEGTVTLNRISGTGDGVSILNWTEMQNYVWNDWDMSSALFTDVSAADETYVDFTTIPSNEIFYAFFYPYVSGDFGNPTTYYFLMGLNGKTNSFSLNSGGKSKHYIGAGNGYVFYEDNVAGYKIYNFAKELKYTNTTDSIFDANGKLRPVFLKSDDNFWFIKSNSGDTITFDNDVFIELAELGVLAAKYPNLKVTGLCEIKDGKTYIVRVDINGKQMVLFTKGMRPPMIPLPQMYDDRYRFTSDWTGAANSYLGVAYRADNLVCYAIHNAAGYGGNYASVIFPDAYPQFVTRFECEYQIIPNEAGDAHTTYLRFTATLLDDTAFTKEVYNGLARNLYNWTPFEFETGGIWVKRVGWGTYFDHGMRLCRFNVYQDYKPPMNSNSYVVFKIKTTTVNQEVNLGQGTFVNIDYGDGTSGTATTHTYFAASTYYAVGELPNATLSASLGDYFLSESDALEIAMTLPVVTSLPNYCLAYSATEKVTLNAPYLTLIRRGFMSYSTASSEVTIDAPNVRSIYPQILEYSAVTKITLNTPTLNYFDNGVFKGLTASEVTLKIIDENFVTPSNANTPYEKINLIVKSSLVAEYKADVLWNQCKSITRY